MTDYMKIVKRVSGGIMCCLLSACFPGFNIRNIDNPPLPPPESQLWKKPGIPELSVKKTLLECGWSGFFRSDPKEEYNGINRIISVKICMENAGFNNIWDQYIPPASSCRQRLKIYPPLPVCQPGAEIPVPSVERRLNSRFCKTYSKNPECLP
jgi:hypothetical protein